MKKRFIIDRMMEPLTCYGVNARTTEALEKLKAKGYHSSQHKSKVSEFSSYDVYHVILPAWCSEHCLDYYAKFISMDLCSDGCIIYVPIEDIWKAIQLLGGNFDVCESSNKLYAVWTRNMVKWNF